MQGTLHKTLQSRRFRQLHWFIQCHCGLCLDVKTKLQRERRTCRIGIKVQCSWKIACVPPGPWSGQISHPHISNMTVFIVGWRTACLLRSNKLLFRLFSESIGYSQYYPQCMAAHDNAIGEFSREWLGPSEVARWAEALAKAWWLCCEVFAREDNSHAGLSHWKVFISQLATTLGVCDSRAAEAFLKVGF